MNVSRETLSLSHYLSQNTAWFADHLPKVDEVWQLLEKGKKEAWIASLIEKPLSFVPEGGFLTKEKITEINGVVVDIDPGVFFASSDIDMQEGVKIDAGAYIKGPCVLGAGTHVRQGAYIRGAVITGKDVVLGHSTECKSAIFFDDAKAGHFAYVGDSILGQEVNLGAGTKISNLKINNKPVFLRVGKEIVKTEYRKFGAILGRGVETGCNSVLNPGVVLGAGSMVYPCVSVANRVYAEKSLISGI